MSKYKNKVIKESGYKCSKCNLTDWLGEPLTLELDHIDGDHKNNEPSNHRLLCPNCHSQTDTFRGRNKNTGIKKINDDVLLDALSSTPNIKQALMKIGLTPKGGNYKRAHALLEISPDIIDTTNGQYGSIWINNGTINKKIKSTVYNEYCEVGWNKGRIVTNKPPSAKGKQWITNGIDCSLVDKSKELPPGWYHGRIVYPK